MGAQSEQISVNGRIDASSRRTAAQRFPRRHPDRLNIRRRTGDDTQNIACRRLLLQRLREFLEQPHVLNRDHSLVGEGFEKLDLRRGEGAHLDATCAQSSNEFPLLTKGNGQEGAPSDGGTTIGKSFCARTSGM